MSTDSQWSQDIRQALQGSRHLGCFYRYLWVSHVDKKTRIARVGMGQYSFMPTIGWIPKPSGVPAHPRLIASFTSVHAKTL